MLSASHVTESLRDSEEPQHHCDISLGEADLSWCRSARSVEIQLRKTCADLAQPLTKELFMSVIEAKPQPRCLLAFAILFSLSVATAAGQSNDSAEGQPMVRRDRAQLTLAGAERAVSACRQKAAAIGVQVNIAVVDDGGHLLAFARMDGARPSSVYTSITKAASAATQRGPTGPLRAGDPSSTHLSLAVENAAAVGGGKYTTLKGGVPILCDGEVIGAVGVGGATGEQDAEVAAAGVAELDSLFQIAKHDSNAASHVASEKLFGKWLVEDIAGRGVIDNAQTTIQIDKDGKVFGSTGVNRYMSRATIDDQRIKFEPGPATTRAAGPPALMDQESSFLAALHKVSKYRVDNNGLLFLLNAQGSVLLRASSME